MPRARRINKDNGTSALPAPPEAELAIANLPAQEPEATVDVEYDEIKNAVIFTVNGLKLAVREPSALDFMNLEAWMRSPSRDEVEELQKRDANFILVKLTSLCSILIEGETKPISYKELCASLVSFKDVEVVATAIGYFRTVLGEYFKRIAKAANTGN